MRKLLQVLGGLLLLLALVFFAYGSMKTAKAADETPDTVEIGVHMIERPSEASDFASKGFYFGGALAVLGIGCLLFSRAVGKSNAS